MLLKTRVLAVEFVLFRNKRANYDEPIKSCQSKSHFFTSVPNSGGQAKEKPVDNACVTFNSNVRTESISF